MSTFNELIDFTRSTTGTYLDSVVYGDELVVNGDFATDISEWENVSVGTYSLTVSSSGLALQGANSTNRPRIYQQIATETGKSYKATINVTSYTSGNFVFAIDANTSFGSVYESVIPDSEGAFTFRFTATGNDQYIWLFGGSGGVDCIIDNVSVKEVIGGQVSGTPLLRTAAINEPRLEYDASGNPLGLLIEEARTNIFRYSQALSNVDHNLITTDNATVSPDGTQNASLCIPTSANVEHFIDDQTVIAGTDYAISCFAKYGSGSYLLSFRGASIGGDAPQFNLQTGTVVNEGASSVWSNTKIEEVGNGWYKCSSVGNPNSASPLRFQIIRSDAVPNFIGDGTGHYIWGAQVETGAFPTSYIPTSGSTVTRAADVASLPVERFAYNDTKGSVVVSARPLQVGEPSGSQALLEIGTADRSQIYLFARLSGTSQSRFLANNGSSQADLRSSDFVGGSLSKMSAGWAVNNFAMSMDGGAALVDTAGAVMTGCTIMGIGTLAIPSSNFLNGHIKQIQYYPKRLSNEELQLLTQPSASPTMNLTFDGQATSTLVEGLHD